MTGGIPGEPSVMVGTEAAGDPPPPPELPQAAMPAADIAAAPTSAVALTAKPSLLMSLCRPFTVPLDRVAVARPRSLPVLAFHDDRPQVVADDPEPVAVDGLPPSGPRYPAVDDGVHGARVAGEDDDAIAHQHGLVDGVRDEDGRGGPLIEYPQHLKLEHVPCLRVQRGERLVHEEHAGLDRQGAREAGPLLHPAGELVRVGGLEPLKADHADELTDPWLRLPARHPAHGQPEGDVAEDCLPREEGELLEHHADALGRLGDHVTGDTHRSAARRGEARHAAEQRGLPAAGRPDDRHDLAGTNIEADARHHGPVAVPLGQLVDADQGDICWLSHGISLIWRPHPARYHGSSQRTNRPTSPRTARANTMRRTRASIALSSWNERTLNKM